MIVKTCSYRERIIYVANCLCGKRDIRPFDAPRESLCECGKWNSFIEVSYEGPIIISESARKNLRC